MNNIEMVILIVTAVISLLGLILGILNIIISIKNRRNSLREKVFEEQLKFFLEINKMNSHINEQVFNLVGPESNRLKAFNELDKIIDNFNTLFESSEILLPDILYIHIDDFINYMNQILIEHHKNESSYTSETLTKISRSIVDINFDMADYLGLEKLSDENRKLARGKKIKERKLLIHKKDR